ncbi:MAG TPA: aminotransferase class V-fold PLP-dependent enzyme [Steroidobacteraceae bacterium]|nr:aminotransferase class V-fold PLP-dependent enzyme [Steroidobacteraceae bacterium]HQW08022.1 aminotransferase class V-fold PLP-dependent enzyme [Steroidobacteraceae bacterium]HQX45996.1 aminotransferase class V-fold PLP-dependent enzyme [Steroidobacteraceae bacterium]HQX77987.1 aminotransferase class V-fold PLP-dependent enzyme [Steroidobacteraceae bacterium]HQZ81005.1 aminotransferase class V-fold PLP-dependent enzyme [Steroidobacteraceae bacterium]
MTDVRERAPVYLDNAATTAVDPRVAAEMAACLTEEGVYGNPSSTTHVYGREAARRVEAARAEVAALIGAQPGEIVFTSGATEASNLAILGTARANADRRQHLVTARTEHRATLDPVRQLEKEGFAVTWLTPGPQGRLAVEDVRAALRPDTLLVSIMHVNNETGAVQEVAAIGAACRAAGVLFHCDLAQGVGKLPTAFAGQIDFGSFTAHKIHGPKGIGALYVAATARPWLAPVMFGGGQERGLRPGTLPTHQVVGFGRACALAKEEGGADAIRVGALREALWRSLAHLPGVSLNSPLAGGSPAILNVSFEGVEGESLVTALTEIAISTGSACSSATAAGSYVLRSLGRSTELAQSSLRFSLGRFTCAADIERASEAVKRAFMRLRSVAP